MNDKVITIVFLAVCAISGLASVIAGIWFLKLHAVLIGAGFLWFAKVFNDELKNERGHSKHA